jgi:phospholipid/cholesterol/gamma-HCH transport system substrate-binding protein
MSRNNGFELFASAAVLLLALGFFAFMRWQTGTGSFSSYRISADMRQADQLAVGTDVRLGGVVIGRITRLTLVPRTYHVSIEMDIRSDIPIPRDSRLGVSGAMMSSPYLSVNPGHSTEPVPPGGSLTNR